MIVSEYSVAHSSSVSKHAAAVSNTQNHFPPEDKYKREPGRGSCLWLQLCCEDMCERKT